MRRSVLASLLAGYLCAQAYGAGRVTMSVAAPEVTQHEATQLPVEIANDTDHAVVLDLLEVVGLNAVGWTEQVYGEVGYVEADDTFVHNRMAQMASALRSASAIVAPGGEVRCAIPLILDEDGQHELTVALSYLVVNSDDVARCIYLPRSVSPMEATYTAATAKELVELAAPHPFEGLPPHFVARNLPRPKRIRSNVTLTVKAAEFPLRDAMERVAVIRHEYDADGNTWLLDTRNGIWLVTKDGAEFRPGLGAREHRFIAESGEAVPFWFPLESLPEEVRAAVRARIAQYEPEEGMGVRFDVPTGDMWSLGAGLAALGLRLELSDFQLTPMLSIRPIER